MAPNATGMLSSRKASAKEKRRRQKDAERVEKLRLLVSYLKSGSSQHIMNPIELEADEIELAQKYNQMHQSPSSLILADLDSSGHLTSASASVSGGGSFLKPSDARAHGGGSGANTSNGTGTNLNSANVSNANSSHNICSGTGSDHSGNFMLSSCRSVPACENGGSADNLSNIESACDQYHNHHHNHPHHHHNHHHHHSMPRDHAGQHNAYIGTISWVLRHSISDPGTEGPYGHSHVHPMGAQDGADGATCLMADHFLMSSSGVNVIATDQSQTNASSCYSESGSVNDHQQAQQTSQQNQQDHYQNHNHDQEHQENGHDQELESERKKERQQVQQGEQQQLQEQLPSTSSSSSFRLVDGSSSNNNPNHLNCDYNHLNSTPAKLFYIDDTLERKGSDSHSNSGRSSTSGVSASGSCVCDNNIGSVTAETSAWRNPQNLAAWIDNEVNSLVNDLEVKSQLIKKKEKHAKSSNSSNSSKYKWLSSSCRRNSSGAHST